MMDHRAQAESRIPAQFRNGEAFKAWIDTLPEVVQSKLEAPAQEVITALDLEAGTGWKLDLIGALVNQPRTGELLEDDDVYRIILKSAIAKNNAIVTIDSIVLAVEYVTGADVFQVVDNQDMSFQIVFDGPVSSEIRSLLLEFDLSPRPQGVRFTGFIEPMETPPFGFSGVSSPAADGVEGFGELGYHTAENADGTTFELSDGSLLGITDYNDPILPTEGGKLAELYEVQ